MGSLSLVTLSAFVPWIPAPEPRRACAALRAQAPALLPRTFVQMRLLQWLAEAEVIVPLRAGWVGGATGGRCALRRPGCGRTLDGRMDCGRTADGRTANGAPSRAMHFGYRKVWKGTGRYGDRNGEA